jgi:hypothetical protein
VAREYLAAERNSALVTRTRQSAFEAVCVLV